MDILSITGQVLFSAAATIIKDALVEAVKKGVNLDCADLRGANLCGADPRSANLRSANLCGADLRSANLRSANLCGADLCGANLCWANLCGANLRGADLGGAYLCGADLGGAKNIPPLAEARLQFIPTQGSFVGWKKCEGGSIVRLIIGAKALRSHSTGRKCRCSYAKVKEIWAEDGTPLTETRSIFLSSFVYRVGEIVRPVEPFNEDRWNECGSGIHFYITRLEAENHS